MNPKDYLIAQFSKVANVTKVEEGKLGVIVVESVNRKYEIMIESPQQVTYWDETNQGHFGLTPEQTVEVLSAFL